MLKEKYIIIPSFFIVVLLCVKWEKIVGWDGGNVDTLPLHHYSKFLPFGVWNSVTEQVEKKGMRERGEKKGMWVREAEKSRMWVREVEKSRLWVREAEKSRLWEIKKGREKGKK